MASRAKKKRILENEVQDAKGISRKKWKFTFSPTLFMLIKLILIILIPIVYFVYSPLLIFVMIAYVGLFFLARMAERNLNKSVIRSNHIHIAKFDSAIALIIVIIALVGTIMSANKKVETPKFGAMGDSKISQMFDDGRFKEIKKEQEWNQFVSNLKNFGSLLTGERNLFEEEKSFDFGSMKPPSDFIADKDDLPADFDFGGEMGMPPNFGGFKGGRKFSMDNIPVDYVSSTMLSTVNTVLIFSVVGFGLLSLILIKLKQQKFEFEMNEVIIEEKITLLSNTELERILSFGEDVVETKQDDIVIIEPSQDEKQEEQTENIPNENVIPEIIEEDEIEILKDDFQFED